MEKILEKLITETTTELNKLEKKEETEINNHMKKYLKKRLKEYEKINEKIQATGLEPMETVMFEICSKLACLCEDLKRNKEHEQAMLLAEYAWVFRGYASYFSDVWKNKHFKGRVYPE